VAARSIIDKNPRSINEIWGVATSRFVFMQEGLGASPPALIAMMKYRDGHMDISGRAGIHLGGLAIFALISIFLLVFGLVQLLENGRSGILAIGILSGLMFYGAAWSNHILRSSADPLVHAFKRAMKAQELADADRRYSDRPVGSATLIVDGDVRSKGISPRNLRDTFLRLTEHQFLIVEFAYESYMQVLNEGGRYRVEVREGSADRHYMAMPDMPSEQAIEALVSYLQTAKRPGDIEWSKIDFD